MTWQIGAFAIVAVALGGGFAWYERARPDARIVALVATLAALAAIGRIAFAAVPNVKPTTDIVLISGYALGGAPGFVVGAVAGLTSNFFFGQGPWTPWQMAGWAAVGLLGAGLAPVTKRRIARAPLALACGTVGFGFTALQDVGDWVTYSDHSSTQLRVYVGKGIGFDLVHAAGCVAFALAFGPSLTRSIQRFAARLQVEWRPARSTVVTLAVIAATATCALTATATAATTPSGYLLGAQNTDGGYGPAPGSPSGELFSGWAALGLAAQGYLPQDVSRGGGPTLLGYVRSGASPDIGSVERTMLVLGAAGVSPGGLLARLDRAIRPDGSVQDQVNLTSFAILALRAVGETPGAGTISWLAHQQDGDGGFNFATGGGVSDVDDTGAALEALAGTGVGDSAAAARFIQSQQNADGGFPANPGGDSNAQSTAFAIQGLLAASAGAGVVERGLRYLRSLIAPDGHVRYSRMADQTPVWVTAQAVMALARKPLPLALPGQGAAPRANAAHSTRVAPASTRGAHAPVRRRGARGARSIATLHIDRLAVDAGVVAALAFAPIG